MIQPALASRHVIETERSEDAGGIAPVTRVEATALAQQEWTCLLETLDALQEDDWSKGTACTAWTVRDMVAHQAGAYAAFSSFGEFRRQYLMPPPKGRLPEDVINEIQIADRQDRTNAGLIAEIREKGPGTIANRQRLPFFIRAISMGRPDGTRLSLAHLVDVIFTRDTWMHRLDLARATNRAMKLTREHDGRIVELVMRDVNAVLVPKVGGDTLAIELTGTAGGAWRIGDTRAARGTTPRATVRMDALDFNIYASGRFSYDEARAKAQIEGDRAWGERMLREISVLY